MKKVWKFRKFEDLALEELYAILALRNSVFVVDQKCPFKDIDGLDDKSIHIFLQHGLWTVAYARVFPPAILFPEASISRVCTALEARSRGLGKELMWTAMHYVESAYPGAGVRIEAQLYLERFYATFGFAGEGRPYIEDGIPHVTMLRRNEQVGIQKAKLFSPEKGDSIGETAN